MTRLSILVWITLLFFQVGLTQETKAIIINPAKQNEAELVKRMYQYSEFIKGSAFYMDGNIVQSMLNYNYLTNQIEFINPKGDTLELIHGNDFIKIVVQSDSF